MGLDMYLTKNTYVGAEYEHRNVKAKIEITVDGKPLNVDVSKISSISERIGYWRKANAIHNWFVTNVQDGVDECQESEVSLKQLTTLRDECKKVLEFKDKADEIMPSQGGFFFGGTDYDEWYFQDMEYTVEILDKVISETTEDDYEITFFYQSSW